MSNNGNGSDKTFKMPTDPREKAVWLQRWISSLFKVYLSVTDHVAAARPEMSFKEMEKEADAVKRELMHLIKPEQWEANDESGKDKI